MAYEARDKTGSLFVNNDKQKDTHPDYRGDCLIDGVAYYVDGWKKTAQSGRVWLSLSFKPKQAKAEAPKPPSRPAERPRIEPKTAFDDMDSEVPF